MKESGCGEEGRVRGMEDGGFSARRAGGEDRGGRGWGKEDGLGRDANDCVSGDGRAKTAGVGGNT